MMEIRVIHDIETVKVGDLYVSSFRFEIPCGFLATFDDDDKHFYFLWSVLYRQWGCESERYPGYRSSSKFEFYAKTKEQAESFANTQIELCVAQLRILNEAYPLPEYAENFSIL